MLTDEQLAEIRARCEAARVTPPSYPGILELMPKHDREQFMKLWNAYQESQRAFHEAAREDIPALLAEVERLRGDAELGRLVRDVMTRLSGTHPVNRYPALLCWSSESWEVQYIHESGIYDTDDDELSATPEDALRKADA